jgi:hypothetical protein
MTEVFVKAFVLCHQIAENPQGTGQKDLTGAGLTVILAPSTFPIQRTFWVYLEIGDHKPNGRIQLSIMRADSGRRLFFRTMPVDFRDPLRTTIVVVRVYNGSFPAPGIYFVELWYDGEWLLDQRLEVVE